MVIKVLIKRLFHGGNLRQASQLLRRTRYGAMSQPGYISSETWSEFHNPNEIVVVSMWRDIEDWQRWYRSPERGEFATELAKLMDGSERIELYAMGMTGE
jgi:heme-degrading monooxygenase HmoA